MKKKVRHTVRNDQGREMYFSGLLMDFLAKKNTRRNFLLGHWVKSLSEIDLDRLARLGKMANINDDAQLDLLQVAVISIGEEEGKIVNLNGEREILEKLSTALEVIKLVVALEGMARRKMLEIISPLSIDPNRGIDIQVDAEIAQEVYSKLPLH